MYREMLEEFESMQNTEDIEQFAFDVLLQIEKEAWIMPVLSTLGRAGLKAAKPLVSMTKNIGGSVGKRFVKKPLQTAFAGLTAVEMGKGFYKPIKEGLQTFQNPMPKLASDDPIMDNITGLGMSDSTIDTAEVAALAAGGYVGGYAGYHALDNLIHSPKVENMFNKGFDKAVNEVGKGTAKAIAKNKPLTGVAAWALAQAGKFLGGGNKRGTLGDFSVESLTKSNTKTKALGGLLAYLGLIGGAAFAEDYLVDKIKNRIKKTSDEDVLDYIDKNASNEEFNEFILQELLKFAEDNSDLILKEAVTSTGKRLLGDRLIRPAVNTGTFLISLGLLSRLVGRNLYGGFEKVVDEKKPNPQRIIIDMPNKVEKVATLTPINENAITGGKDATEAVKDSIELNENKTFEKAKKKIDGLAQKIPGVKKLDNLLAGASEYKYKGRTGIGHLLLEDIPFKAVEGLAYVSPMVAAAILLNRNPKRAFAPIEDEPGIPTVPDGMTRIVIQKNPANVEKTAGEIPPSILGLSDDTLNLIRIKLRAARETELDKVREETDSYSLEEQQKRVDKALEGVSRLEGKVVQGLKKQERFQKQLN